MNKEETESMESRIQQAMRSRLKHFTDQSESLTFEGVRRLLEKDLVLDTYALDAHKKYVKKLLEKYLSGAEDDETVSKDSKENKLEEGTKEEEVGPTEEKVTKEDEVKIEEEGILSENKSENQENLKDKILTEDMITKALWKRATYFRSKSEELTVAGVRRLLEEDLEVDKFSLDPFKKLISKQLDEVLNPENEAPNKTGTKSDEEEIIQVKPKKKGKIQEPKKRKSREIEGPKKKKIKQASVDKKKVKDESGSESESSGVKVEKEAVAPVYGKKVERLKSIIKACGMSVAPTLYKKAKQAPENKREAILIKELQDLLSKEGLSANPSEKEIKDVKRRKERAKELEGIDTSNIVVGSRRRSTFSFVAPPKPVESDADDSEQDSDNEDEDGSEEGSDNDNDNDDDNVQEGTDNDNDDNVQDGDDENDKDNVPEEVHEETFDSD